MSLDLDYDLALEYLFKIKGEKRGLENIKTLCSLFDNPEKNYKIVHVGGTNGKGSVSAYLAKILEEGGYKVALFTSPHVDRFSERIKVMSLEIEKEFVVDFIDQIKTIIEKEKISPTFFEINTIMALKYFSEKRVDVAIIEVGVGGKMDATNIVDPILSIIATVAFDHEAYLGSDLKKIASHKGGIIKKGRPVVIGDISQEALSVLIDTAKANSSESLIYGRDFFVKIGKDHKFTITFRDNIYSDLVLSIPGDHFRHNASLAVLGSSFFEKVKKEHVIKSLSSKNILPGRSEFIKYNGKNILFDVCHNPEGAKAFSLTIKNYFKSYDRVFVLASILRNKSFNEMIGTFCQDSYCTTITIFNHERSFDPDNIDDFLKNKVVIIKDTKMALEANLDELGRNDLLAVAGSFYFLSEIRRILFNPDCGRNLR
jgi:dihydrofolate synthase / folylpolyglutamate synthase